VDWRGDDCVLQNVVVKNFGVSFELGLMRYPEMRDWRVREQRTGDSRC